MGNMVVVPEPGGQTSRQHVTMAIEFVIGSTLVLESIEGNLGLFLRVQAVQGLVFDVGCLAAVPDLDYSLCVGSGRVAVVQIRANMFASGEHRLALAGTNPPWTPDVNLWTLESFVRVTFQDASAGLFKDVRHRGRTQGYPIQQTLLAHLQPASTEVGVNAKLLIWFRPSVYVESFGFLEIHAGQAFLISCTPGLFLITLPSGTCRSYIASSSPQTQDLHSVVEFQLNQDEFLLPNNEYEFAMNARNPKMVNPDLSKRWGLRLTTSLRSVLEANLDIPQYDLTDRGMFVVSVVPGIIAPYARNQIRLRLTFTKTLTLKDISEIRIVAPPGWDFRPLCHLFDDITGGCISRCPAQLPYSEVRGHHTCPKANLMFLMLDQKRTINAGTYTLLLGAMNPAAVPTRNWWTVSLITAADNVGWTPGTNDVGYVDGLRLGQTMLTMGTTFGFDVGDRQDAMIPPVPLTGEFLEMISKADRWCRNLVVLAVLGVPIVAST